MTRALRWLAVLAVAGAPVLAQTLYVSPDAQFDPGIGVFIQPLELYEHNAGIYGFAFGVPGLPGLLDGVDATHRLDAADQWLVSLAAPASLGGLPGGPAQPHDVIRWNGGGFVRFFDGDAIPQPIPAGTNVDAIYLESGDFSDLVLSFDLPTEVPPGNGVYAQPADLVRYLRTGPGAADWQLDTIVFVAASAGAGIPAGVNVIGADHDGTGFVLTLDTPAALSPSTGPPYYGRGDVVSWDGASFDLYDSLASWPSGTRTDAVSCQSNPGGLDTSVVQLTMRRGATLADAILDWGPSCSQGAEDYAIYEGFIGSWTGHVKIDCQDGGTPFTEQVTPGAGDMYYLVVPFNAEEGSYGLDFVAGVNNERMQPANPGDRCVVPQTLTPCP